MGMSRSATLNTTMSPARKGAYLMRVRVRVRVRVRDRDRVGHFEHHDVTSAERRVSDESSV
jgi:hypothetical protein